MPQPSLFHRMLEGRAWAQSRFLALLASPASLPNLGYGYSLELRAARAVQTVAHRRLFYPTQPGLERRERQLAPLERAYWRGVLSKANELALLEQDAGVDEDEYEDEAAETAAGQRDE